MNRLWSRPGLWAVVGSHTLADFYIGAVEATLPYLVTRAHYSYAAIAGLSLAMTGVASISQPGFGFLADKHRLRWAVPACIAVTGLCASLAAADPNQYLYVWVMIALAGMASAGYHPPATVIVREIAPGSNVVISVFAAAGNLGVALGPLAVVAVVGPMGLSATSWLIVPGALGLALYLLAGRQHYVLRQRIRPKPAAAAPSRRRRCEASGGPRRRGRDRGTRARRRRRIRLLGVVRTPHGKHDGLATVLHRD